MGLFGLALSAILINNIILSKFLGICPFLGVSKKSSSALGMGGAVIFVIFISSIVTYAIYHLILVPLNIEFMNLITFILVIALLYDIIASPIILFSFKGAFISYIFVSIL